VTAALPQTKLEELTGPLVGREGACCPTTKSHPCCQPFGLRALGLATEGPNLLLNQGPSKRCFATGFRGSYLLFIPKSTSDLSVNKTVYHIAVSVSLHNATCTTKINSMTICIKIRAGKNLFLKCFFRFLCIKTNGNKIMIQKEHSIHHSPCDIVFYKKTHK